VSHQPGRHKRSVEVELVRQGVPASSISVIRHGQNGLLVPTAVGVRMPENRRIEIAIAQPELAPVAAAPVEPPPSPPEPDRFLFELRAVPKTGKPL
jgi:hypothetical protein